MTVSAPGPLLAHPINPGPLNTSTKQFLTEISKTCHLSECMHRPKTVLRSGHPRPGRIIYALERPRGTLPKLRHPGQDRFPSDRECVRSRHSREKLAMLPTAIRHTDLPNLSCSRLSFLFRFFKLLRKFGLPESQERGSLPVIAASVLGAARPLNFLYVPHSRLKVEMRRPRHGSQMTQVLIAYM